jgi:site-specific recombinase XerD
MMIQISTRERVYILKRGKYWAARYMVNGKAHHQSLKVTTRREAMDLAREIEDQLNALCAPIVEQDTPTYAELVRRFLEFKDGQGRCKATLVAYKNHFNNFGRFIGKDRYADQLTPAHFEDYPAARKKEINRNVKRKDENGNLILVNHPTTKTIREELISLATLFKWAVKRRYIKTNPADSIEMPKVPELPPRYLTYAQYKELHAAIVDEEFKDVVDLYLLSGMRRAEGILLSIRNNIDLERNILTIRQPKQGDYRKIPISGELERVIRRLIIRAGKSDQLVRFHEDTLTWMFHEYAVKAGLPGNHSFHVLRHTFGTWLAERGLNQTEIQLLMGHRDPGSTRKYVHAYAPNLARSLAKLTLPAMEETVTKTSQDAVAVCAVCTPDPAKALENRQIDHN